MMFQPGGNSWWCLIVCLLSYPSTCCLDTHPFVHIGQVDLGQVPERGRLLCGAVYNDEAVLSPETASLKASLVASIPGTTIISFTTEQVDKVRHYH